MLIFYNPTTGVVVGCANGFEEQKTTIDSTITLDLNLGHPLEYLAREFDDPSNPNWPLDYRVIDTNGALSLQLVADQLPSKT